ncbi:GreA/GreB family elongation factor [Kitasatospora sp. NPDC059327]|uniref:GreA/GreB family elongation factor n=1 Tax=Kitasatospora sp. NPDC059327 TaxID=3346803 RepID=UPI0036913DAA
MTGSPEPTSPEPISPEARQALDQELAQLRVERDAVAATLKGAGSDTAGDLADQADELQRVTEVARLESRIAGITARLSEAATAVAAPSDVVGVGSSVTLRFADGTQETVQIGELANESEETLATYDSPLGHALLGHRTGDSVTYDTPAGPTTAVVLGIGAP